MEKAPERNKEKKPESEKEAFESLKSSVPLEPKEQYRLVLLISDPEVSVEALMLTETESRTFTPEEREYLAKNIESHSESVYIFFLNLVEAGVMGELNETEHWLVERLKNSLLEITEPSAAAYIQENILPLLSEKGKNV